MSAAKRFEKIAERASEEATEVKCSRAEYVEGLEVIRDRIEDDLNAARETLGDGS